MATEIKAKKISDFLLSELPGYASRKLLTVASGQTLKRGQPAKISPTTGKVSALTSLGNEAHTFNPDANPSAGSFKLRLWHKDGYWVETASIAYNAAAGSDNTTAGTIRYAIAQVLGDVANTVSGTAATSIVLTFAGTGYAGRSFPLGSMVIDNLTGVSSCAVTRSTPAGLGSYEVQLLNIGGTISGGSFKLGIYGPNGERINTDTIAHNATFATVITNINAALDDALGAGQVVASGSAYTAITLAYSGSNYTGKSVPTANTDVAGLTGATTSSVERQKQVNVIALDDMDASAADLANQLFLFKDAVVAADELWWYGLSQVYGAAVLAEVGIEVRTGGGKYEPGF